MSPASPSAPRARLARLVAGLHPSAPRSDGLAGLGDDEQMVELADAHSALGLYARQLDRDGSADRLDEAARVLLRRTVMRRQRERFALDEAADRAVEALGEIAVEPVLLKGAALGREFYPQPHLRPMSDVDLLLPLGRLEEALAVLGRRGFRTPSAEDVGFWKAAYYNLPVEWLAETSVQLELHWSIAQPDRHRPEVTGLLERSCPLAGAPEPARRLGDVDLLLHQSLHHSYHLFQPKLIWVYDLALLHLDPPPLGEVLARARRWGMATALALSCSQVEKVFPGCLSPDYAEWARAHRRARWLLRVFGSADPVSLFSGWERRRRQLLLTFLMLDGPLQAFGSLAAWGRRSLRFGDREGHRRLENFRPGAGRD